MLTQTGDINQNRVKVLEPCYWFQNKLMLVNGVLTGTLKVNFIVFYSQILKIAYGKKFPRNEV